MSTSVKYPRARTLRIYAAATLFCILFALIYEYFSHGVYSAFLLGMFAFPLLGGVAPCVLLCKAPARAARYAWHAGVATLTVGSCVHGIFDIYGTSAPLVTVYWGAGGLLLAAGLVLWRLRARVH